MNYPDANGAKGSQLVPEAATGFPKVSNSGKTYDFNVKVPVHEVLERPGRDGRELQGGDRPRRRPEDAVPVGAVLLGHRRLRQVARLGRQGQGLAPDHQPDQGCP